eukprot:6066455-Pyramimonas_sp.AAC.1
MTPVDLAVAAHSCEPAHGVSRRCVNIVVRAPRASKSADPESVRISWIGAGPPLCPEWAWPGSVGLLLTSSSIQSDRGIRRPNGPGRAKISGT